MRMVRLAVAALLAAAFWPGDVSAQVAVQSAHELNIRVQGDARGYARVNARRPMTFEVVGPGQLTVVLRQELDADQTPGQTVTEATLVQGNRTVESFRMRGTSTERYVGAGALRPTGPTERQVDVGEGVQRFTLRVDTRGHQIVASVGFAPAGDDLDLMPLVPLAPDGAARADAGDDDDIPLAALTPPASDDDDGDLPLVGLIPSGPADPDDEPGTPSDPGDPVVVAQVDLPPGDDTGRDGPGGIVGPPGREGPGTTRTARLLLGFRGLAATTGMGGNTLGGGVDLMLRTGLMDDRLAFGLSADLVPYRLVVSRVRPDGSLSQSHLAVQAMPVMVAANYVLPGAGPLKWHVTAGVGPVIAAASDDHRAGRTILFGGVLAAGPLLEVGPGALSSAVRISGGYGHMADARGATLMNGPLGGLGLTVGYVLSI